MTDFVHLLYDVKDNTAWVTLNRPEKLNASPGPPGPKSKQRSTTPTLTMRSAAS